MSNGWCTDGGLHCSHYFIISIYNSTEDVKFFVNDTHLIVVQVSVQCGFLKVGIFVHYYILPSPSNTMYSIDLCQHFTVQEPSGKYVYHPGTYIHLL
jgi:hypothetical protein